MTLRKMVYFDNRTKVARHVLRVRVGIDLTAFTTTDGQASLAGRETAAFTRDAKSSAFRREVRMNLKIVNARSPIWRRYY